MPIHISKYFDGRDTTVRIDGRLLHTNAGELEKACELFDGRLTLDLSALKFADVGGVRIINQLVSRGALLKGVSQYLRLLLAQPGD
jgi:anti-anti-sigma regulatory factor